MIEGISVGEHVIHKHVEVVVLQEDWENGHTTGRFFLNQQETEELITALQTKLWSGELS